MDAPRPVGVRIANLHKRYGGTEALRGLNLEVHPGEIFGLLGPNGAGKTTALECLLGLRTPDSGTIEIGGLDARRHPRDVRAQVGALLQDAALQDKITPREAIALFASFYRNAGDVDTLLDRFGLREKASARFETLSGGQRRRLFLALTFANRPRLIVLDEPTSGLDPRGRRELHDLIRSLRDAGCTVLLSTHDLPEAESLCDRVTILHEGRVIADSPPATLVGSVESAGRIRFSAVPPPTEAACAALPGVTRAQASGGEFVLHSGDIHRSSVALMALLERDGSRLTAMEVLRPTLEDVFLRLTGRPWPDEPPQAGEGGRLP
ncbi:daunorubicin/doxorubicin resistance ATP-binding protein DrrA [mine drainage metagenome]|uniref:Daunorubicin/doxorubicin resistance ATP-binding protein DrrA n=1 Tax=mine drainage metagenome TaxID=410659 RepID=A0A1J5T2B8_9ZZZZ